MKSVSRMSLAGLIVASVVGSLDVQAQQATGSFQRSLTVEELGELEVATGSGSIVVSNGEPGHVEVSGKITVGSMFGRSRDEAEALVEQLETNPPIELSGDHLRIGRMGDDWDYRNVSISYTITLPAETAVKAHSGSGRVSVQGVSGQVAAGTGSGVLDLQDLDGAVEARTGSGSIHALRIAGSFEGGTGSGTVELEQTAPGDVNISTGSGGIEIRGVDGALNARAGSGTIRIDGKVSGPWNLVTGSGSIHLRLPPDAAFDLDAHTGSGSVSTEHAVMLKGQVERGRLRGKVGGGGPLVQLRTGSGSIVIE
jgi:DUF4097 and DUF4098 domain-containing protein YvlB